MTDGSPSANAIVAEIRFAKEVGSIARRKRATLPLLLLANPTGDSRTMYLARKVLALVNLRPLEVYRALHVHLPSKFSRRVDGETSFSRPRFLTFAPSRLAGNRTKLSRGCRINNKVEGKVDRGYRSDSQSLSDFGEKFAGFEPRRKYL